MSQKDAWSAFQEARGDLLWLPMEPMRTRKLAFRGAEFDPP
jgi:hypothetical protein